MACVNYVLSAAANAPEATLIEGVEGNVDFNQPVYDLSGRRVKNAQKGIYIIGGKKVILK